jgi:hypothetical protein
VKKCLIPEKHHDKVVACQLEGIELAIVWVSPHFRTQMLKSSMIDEHRG